VCFYKSHYVGEKEGEMGGRKLCILERDLPGKNLLAFRENDVKLRKKKDRAYPPSYTKERVLSSAEEED